VILCVGLAADETFVYTVAALIAARAKIRVLDLGQLAYSGSLQIYLDEPLDSVLELHKAEYRLDSFDGAWVRMVDISGAAPTQQLARRSSDQYRALCKLFEVVPYPVVNPPARNASNFSKVLHSTALGSMTGWQVPRTCLTNDAEEARTFISSCPQGAIFKGVSGQKTWASTYDQRCHESRLELLLKCPTLFQERIDGPDVRVHTVGDEVFAEAIESRNLDYRKVRGNRYTAISPPDDVVRGCRALVVGLGVPFLGVDFKVARRTNDWFFLEANAAPCYQGYDRRADRAISRSIAKFLSRSNW